MAGGKIMFGVGKHDNVGTTIISTTSVADGAWHKVRASRQRASGMLKLYIDDVLEKAYVPQYTSTHSVTGVASVMIGALLSESATAGDSAYTADRFFPGSLRNLRIYDTYS